MFKLFLLSFGVILSEAATYKLDTTYDASNFLSSFWFDTKDYTGDDRMKPPKPACLQYVNEQDALSGGLFNTKNGKIYLGADHTKNTHKRSSTKVKSHKQFNQGNLFIMQLDHMPGGCGTWPAWWLVGPDWPSGGEIDIIEQVNDAKHDQTTLHTENGCYRKSGPITGGTPDHQDTCYVEVNYNAGCAFKNDNPTSFGSAFNNVGGGAYALLWDSYGIRAWMWNTGKIPQDVLNASPDPETWGNPYANFEFGSSCEAHYFSDMTMIINTELCGQWAGPTFKNDCPQYASQTCEEFIYTGANMKEAYWLIDNIKIYSVSGTPSKTSGGGTSPTAPPPSSGAICFHKQLTTAKCAGTNGQWVPDTWGETNANSYSSQSSCLGRKMGNDRYCGDSCNSQWCYAPKGNIATCTGSPAKPTPPVEPTKPATPTNGGGHGVVGCDTPCAGVTMSNGQPACTYAKHYCSSNQYIGTELGSSSTPACYPKSPNLCSSWRKTGCDLSKCSVSSSKTGLKIQSFFAQTTGADSSNKGNTYHSMPYNPRHQSTPGKGTGGKGEGSRGNSASGRGQQDSGSDSAEEEIAAWDDVNISASGPMFEILSGDNILLVLAAIGVLAVFYFGARVVNKSFCAAAESEFEPIADDLEVEHH